MALTKGEARRLAQNAKATGPCQHKITYVQGTRDRNGILYHVICYNCHQVIEESKDRPT